MKLKTKIILGTIGLILVFSIILFIVSINLGYAPDYLTKIICKEQPYEAIEYYNEQEPYQAIEYYYEREPYTTCAGYSFWTGKCNNWKTEYRNTEKTRYITKYRSVQKSRTITKYRQICVRIYLWKSVNYSENWFNYPELYDAQGNKIPHTVA